jgi:hypothetical protein
MTTQSKLGGGEGVEGIYGSITATGMQKIFDCMHHNCALDTKSRLIDIGAGLGRCGRDGSPFHGPFRSVLNGRLSSSPTAATDHPHPPGAVLTNPHRPLLHAALRYGLSGAYGVELDPVKCSKADAFVRHVIRELDGRGIAKPGMATPLITRAPVERVSSSQ